MLVSIIVPVYNVERYLRQCLDSLRAQTLQSIEFVCVDDGSTDGSLEILREYEAADVRFRVLTKPNAGYGHTINLGIANARGEYVGILESDDFCQPTMYETLYRHAAEHDLDIVRSTYNLYWSEPVERIEPVPCGFGVEYGVVFDPRAYRQCFLFSPALWSMLVRRSIIEDNGLRLLETPGASFQDTSFSFKLWACARRALVIDEALLFYRQDNEASSINQKGKLHCVPDELAEIERFVRSDSDRYGDLLPVMTKRKFAAYAWNYERIASEFHAEFARLASKEMRAARDEGLLDKDLFSSDEWTDVYLLIDDPDRYVTLHDAENDAALTRYRRFARIRRALSGRL